MADRRYTINAFTVNLQLPLSPELHGSENFNRKATEALLRLLSEEDVKATFFVEPRLSATMKAFVQTLPTLGHEIGLLLPTATDTMATEQDRQTNILINRKNELEDITGSPVKGCRILQGDLRPELSTAAYSALAQAGLAYSSSLYPPRNFRLGVQNSKRRAWITHVHSGDVWELPITAWRPLGLGIFSIRSAHPEQYPAWVIARNIEGMNRHGEPALLALRLQSLISPNVAARTVERLQHIFRAYRFSTTLDAFASRLTTQFEEEPSPRRRTGIVRCDAQTALPFL